MDNIYDTIIRYFSSQENDFAVMINGEWGCGKTYFIKNHIDTAEKIGNKNCYLIYIPISGTTSISDIKSQITMSILEKADKNFLQNLKKVKKRNPIFKIIEALKNEKINTTIDIASIIIDTLYKRTYMGSEIELRREILLVIDDLERYAGDIHELFAFMHNNYVLRGIHLIYIANEKAIPDSEDETGSLIKGIPLINKNTSELYICIPDDIHIPRKKTPYKEMKEKFIRYTIYFPAVDRHIIENVINEHTKFTDSQFRKLYLNSSNKRLINDELHKFRLTNLRTLMSSIDCFDYFISSQKISDPLLQIHLFMNILVINDYEKKGKYEPSAQKNQISKSFSEYLSDKGYSVDTPNAYYNNDGNATQTKNFIAFAYQDVILEYLHNGYVEKSKISNFIQTYYQNFNDIEKALRNILPAKAMEEQELDIIISKIIESINNKTLPFGRILKASGFLSEVEKISTVLNDQIYRKDILNAIKDTSYPGRSNFMINNHKHITPIQVATGFYKEALKEMNEQIDLFWEKTSKLKIQQYLEDIQKSILYVNDSDKEKSVQTIISIHKFGLIENACNMNNRGIYNLKNEIANLPDPIAQVPQVIKPLEELRKNLSNKLDIYEIKAGLNYYLRASLLDIIDQVLASKMYMLH